MISPPLSSGEEILAAWNSCVYDTFISSRFLQLFRVFWFTNFYSVSRARAVTQRHLEKIASIPNARTLNYSSGDRDENNDAVENSRCLHLLFRLLRLSFTVVALTRRCKR